VLQRWKRERWSRRSLYGWKWRGGSIRIQHLAHASTPGSFQASYKPHEKPLLQARYRLIYSRKVAIVDIKPATPTLYRKRVACVALRWVVSVNARHTSFTLLSLSMQNYLPYPFIRLRRILDFFEKSRNSYVTSRFSETVLEKWSM